ncbi:LuxR C-terminal-related transcriptional regulator [Mucilaginibacter sp. BJC16-A38]|uniref:response regulator transcription factor n=1 Tax=Mucilaginibacter phenanthrenivorans TaxID=1234842 RepID=UPI002157BADD|nr:LuxR C-terminal-related transcriptional regulator [Mucilaginibacter phenanthrenivorans]MCR8557068.1 LuxR C-terminal-related transcriptional regulator [Mucilaginibacter phenanthrenivorans]
MTYPTLKISVKIGIAVALAIILFQVSNILLVYKYFKFDYYLTAVAVFFLLVGFFISRRKSADNNKTDASKNPALSLTNKEIAILQLIADGKSNKEIASINFVEVSTIKTHINNIYTKLGVRNRKEAVVYYRKQV